MERVRIDKWLWAARFFKTRALATRACDLGRVAANGVDVKPARDVKTGDLLRVKTEGGEFEVEVLGLSDIRGPAPVAQALYRETEASKIQRAKVAEERKVFALSEPIPQTRPSKRDRRELTKFRGRS